MQVMPVPVSDESERHYQMAVYLSGVIRDEKLNGEQRKQWKQFIGTEVHPADLEVLQRSYYRLQVHSVKAPPKVEQP
jgi:hypothetical protein